MPTTTRSQATGSPSARSRTAPSPCGSMPLSEAPSRRSTPCSRCRLGEDRGDLRTEDPQQRLVERLDQGHLGIGVACGGGDLEADPATADDADPGAGGQRGLDAAGVLHGAQVDDRRAALVGHPEVARARAGGEHEVVVRRPVGPGDDLARGEVERGDARAGVQVDVVLGVPRPPRAPAPCPRCPCRAAGPSTAAGVRTARRGSSVNRVIGPSWPPSRSWVTSVPAASPPPTTTTRRRGRS